jgi:hypothetical protein
MLSSYHTLPNVREPFPSHPGWQVCSSYEGWDFFLPFSITSFSFKISTSEWVLDCLLPVDHVFHDRRIIL